MKRKQFLAAVLILFTPVISAQVTIGSDIPPEEAALLDLKTQEATTDGGATTDKNGGGLLLPRVVLDNQTDLTPFLTQGIMSDDEYSKLKLRHKGLMVYNLALTNGFTPGIYNWNGERWKSIHLGNSTLEKEVWLLKGNEGTDPDKDFIGTTDDKALSIRTHKVERIRITKDGKIGIKTTADPVTDLEVNGTTRLDNTLFLKNTPVAPTEDVAQLVVDDNGKVYSISSSTGNTKMLNYIKYTFTNLADQTTVPKGNGISCLFNTLIPTNDYTVVIVGSSFKTDDQQNGLKVTSGIGTYTSQSVYAFKRKITINGSEVEQWSLYADYQGGETATGKGGEWTIYCLTVNNSSVKTLPDISIDMKNSAVGSAEKEPEGL